MQEALGFDLSKLFDLSSRCPHFWTNFISGDHLESGRDFRANPTLLDLIKSEHVLIWFGLSKGKTAVEWNRIQMELSSGNETNNSGRSDTTRDLFCKTMDTFDRVMHKMSRSVGHQGNVTVDVSANKLP